MRNIVLGLVALASLSVARAEHLSVLARVEQAMSGEHRSAANIARNPYRHPLGTLEFFGLRDDMHVMEIWPGAGWYTEILAPVMRDHGQLSVASYDPDVPDQPEYRYRLANALKEKLAAAPALYDQVHVVNFSSPATGSLGNDDSLDMILTFRNAHGWVGDGSIDAMLTEFYRVLKKGGVLGIVQHRANQGAEATESAKQGYLAEDVVIEMARKAGFQFDARSEVNANPRDDKNHPEGVWTLPPSLRLGDENREHYLSIGESDRMTLRFIKQ